MNKSGYIVSIKKYAIHDGPGIRTTVFFKGCPLTCWWCHNPECQVSPSNLVKGSTQTTVEEVMDEVNKDIIFYNQSGGGITFSGGEPLAQLEFLFGLLEACKENGLHTAVDTCGYAKCQHFEKIFDFVDLFLYDLKIYNDDEHIKYTGVSNKLIHENLMLLSHNNQNIRIRVPLIPGVSDTQNNLSQIAQFVLKLPNITTIDLLPYNRLGISKYRKRGQNNKLRDLPTQTKKEIIRKQELFESYGFNVNIGGG